MKGTKLLCILIYWSHLRLMYFDHMHNFFFIVPFRKFRGSLKICSKSIIFEPDDNIQPIIKVSSANWNFLVAKDSL